MIKLKRGRGQRIMIGDDIIVTLISQDKSQSWIGVQAPPDFPVDREEVYFRKQAEKTTEGGWS